MTVDSHTVLLVQNDVAPDREPGFDAWYLADHMPDRVGTPGFRRARRWRAFEGGPRDLSLYEIDGPEVMSSAPYLARLAKPTEGTRQYMDAFIGMRRSVCEVIDAEGFADGGCAALLPFMSQASDTSLSLLIASDRWRADPEAGIVARAVFRCDATASRSDSVESRLRRGADRITEVAAWIEAGTPEQVRLAVDAARAAAASAGLVADAPALLRLVAGFRNLPGTNAAVPAPT
jgi:hypothetical protein